ncbi:MAG TPA: nucleotidyltransferase family protein [Gemmatimonadaceae bacterium]|nr:nucleotidyltransferase family protein [Gemmatimonadaceae bacterium]
MPKSSSTDTIAGVVLAAGASRRMGTNKLLLELDGESLIRRAVSRANEAGLAPVIVVLGHDVERVSAELTELECEIVVNPDPSRPMSASMHLALAALPPKVSAAVVVLPDMIHVTTAMLRDIGRAARAGEQPLVVSRYGSVTAPPILYRRALFAELLEWNGEGCGKPIVQRHMNEALVKDWPESALADVDTPADFAAVKRS